MGFWETADELVARNGTSYSWVCAMLGVPESTVSMQRKRRTEPKVEFAVRFAHLLGVSVESLVGFPAPDVVPERLRSIVADLNDLDDDDLEAVEIIVASLKSRGNKKRTAAEPAQASRAG